MAIIGICTFPIIPLLCFPLPPIFHLLNGGYNGQVGVGKSFAVYPGDKVKIEAYAKFEGTNSSNASPFASALLSAFGLSAPGTGETGTARAGLNTWGTLVDAGYHQPDPARPQAHVTILILDRDYNFLDFATQQISDSPEQVGASPDVDHEYLTREYTIKEPGFVYMYVSNNSPVNVYFDDVTFTHTPTRVIQYNEYYPFGLQTSSSWTRENNSNDFLYNAGAELNSAAGWYETFFRGYDPALGRFNQVDPMASAASSFTPYNYAFNSPVLLNDPMGIIRSIILMGYRTTTLTACSSSRVWERILRRGRGIIGVISLAQTTGTSS